MLFRSPNTEADAATLRIDVAVRAAAGTAQSPTMAAEEAERRIAAHVASVVPDRATIQIGLGALPDAVLGLLSQHKDLGLHSGLVGDSAVALIESGAITNAHKGLDPGVSVTNTLGGTTRAHRHAHDNPHFLIRPATYTHHPVTLASLHRFHAINSALEVDITGQANAEHDGRTWRGGLGGLGDFVRTARLSEGGRGIVALASTHHWGLRQIGPAQTSLEEVFVNLTQAEAQP